ncbi:hypothetical protein QTP70_015264 [Hemibagrus guttatus]|uniref:Ig-like domain-containing protein n=1 Tax=Hemibagrus guttatus TaxID=175788 RepID=A0AAE0VA88_9TELE|nr:hypothetical protein QTP70_015264 [Hemibagrus guttatus]
MGIEVPQQNYGVPSRSTFQHPSQGLQEGWVLHTAVRPISRNNSETPIPGPKAQGNNPLVYRGKLQHMAAELGGYKQAHPSPTPLTMGHSREEEGPTSLKELGSIAQAVCGGKPDYLQTVFSGETVTLRCDIQGESVSSWQYSWYKDASHSPVSSVQVYRISGVEVTPTGKYTRRGAERGGSRSSHSSDAVTLTVSERAVLSVSPQSWLTEGDSVTLSCEVTDSSTDWTFSWYTVVFPTETA